MCRTLPAFGGLLVSISLPLGLAAEEDEIDFNRDIRPILSDKCFQCHGPDEETLEAGLRLDLRDSALAEKALIPGDPDGSELMARILSEDRDDVMPPPKVKKPVTKQEAELLRRWITQGGEYAGHWAFEPIAEVSPPEVKQSDWPKNPIDQFILAKLEAKGIEPAPEAEAGTLARRLSLDLDVLVNDEGEEVPYQVCTTLVVPGGEQNKTVTIGAPSIVAPEGYFFFVPGVESARLELVVP